MGLDSCIEEETTSDSDEQDEEMDTDDQHDGPDLGVESEDDVSTQVPSEQGTVTGSPQVSRKSPRATVDDVSSDGEADDESDPEPEVESNPDHHYHSSRPLPVDIGAINFHGARQRYALDMLPLRPIYVPSAATFAKLLYIIHHPRQTIIAYLLGFEAGQWFDTTAQIEQALLTLSPVDCLRRTNDFHQLVDNFTALGVAHQPIWEQVIIANKLLGNVLYKRRAIPNEGENKFVVPFMDGEGLPAVVFTPFSEGMEKLHSVWAADFEARARAGRVSSGFTPVQTI
jgi:hypothetical protein